MTITDVLPRWKARILREAATPLKGKPLRDTKAYLRSLEDKERIPTTTVGYAFLRAITQ